MYAVSFKYNFFDLFCYRTKLAVALETVTEVLLKKQSRSTNLILQHLILVLRHKAELVQTLLAEERCTVESFHWRSRLQYSMEMEELYSPLDLATSMNKLAAIRNQMMPSFQSVLKYPPPTAGDGGQSHRNSTTFLMASSRSLLNSRQSVSDINRSQNMPSFRGLGGCAPPLKCFVHCHNATLPYGFEFLGGEAHLFLTPQTESALLSLVRAMAKQACTSITSSSTTSSGKATIAKDLSVVSVIATVMYLCTGLLSLYYL